MLSFVYVFVWLQKFYNILVSSAPAKFSLFESTQRKMKAQFDFEITNIELNNEKSKMANYIFSKKVYVRGICGS